MITRKPRPGDVLETFLLYGGWKLWGTVKQVESDLVYCHGKPPFYWCFGTDGCLGNNAAFRIVESAPVMSPKGERITMDDPLFN